MPVPPLSLYLFGPMRVAVHGDPLPRVRTRSVEWILALLTLRHGRAVSRAWLAGTLWPESTEERALTNLREDLVRLRKALGTESGRIQSPTRDTLLLDLTDATADVLAFDSAIRQKNEEGLRAAIAVYAGPLLEGYQEDWVFPERNPREAQFLEALETLAGRAEERGEFTEALTLLRRAETVDRLRDSIQRGLMRALAASGDTPAALTVFQEHRARLRRELNAEPDSETTGLFRQIRDQMRLGKSAAYPAPVQEPQVKKVTTAASLPLPPSASVPHPLTQLIGRDQDVQTIVRQLTVSRLVTLAGGGGVGKTRLAIQVAQEIKTEFPDGAGFVALASLSDPTLLPSFAAKTLGCQEQETTNPEAALAALAEWLSPFQVLVILDNCEQIIEATASMAQVLLERCPRLKILATSRERLNLTGETLWRVPSLPSPNPERLPENPEAEVLEYPAAQLFVERAAMAKSGFRLTSPEDALAVAQICRRLDGVPLAIELAAARLGMLSATQIAARLDDRFRLLTAGSRGVLPRHQTLQALIDWSYDLLTPQERALLRHLSVFADGWTLEAAEALFEETDADLLDLLASLTNKSLVLAGEEKTGVRYRILETVREYALRKLRESGEEEQARHNHLIYFLSFAEQHAQEASGPGRKTALDSLETEIGNFRSALAWAQTPTAPPDASLRLTAALWPFWQMRGYLSEGREHLRIARRLARQTDGPVWAQALLGAATLAVAQQDVIEGITLGQESLERFRTRGDLRGCAAALECLGEAALSQGDFAAAGSLYTEMVGTCDRCGWIRGKALALAQLGVVAIRERDTRQARTLLEQGLALAESVGDSLTIALSLRRLGQLAWETGDLDRARVSFEKCLETWKPLGYKQEEAETLLSLGLVVQSQSKFSDAVSLLKQSAALFHELGNRMRYVWALIRIGNAHFEAKDYPRALALYRESLVVAESANYPLVIACTTNNIGCTLFRLGDTNGIASLHRKALAIYVRRNAIDGIVWSLNRIAIVEGIYGDFSRAAQLLGAAWSVRESAGIALAGSDRTDWERAVATASAGVGEAVFAELYDAGLRMSQEQAVEFAL